MSKLPLCLNSFEVCENALRRLRHVYEQRTPLFPEKAQYEDVLLKTVSGTNHYSMQTILLHRHLTAQPSTCTRLPKEIALLLRKDKIPADDEKYF